jgi:hypothetical protein
MRVSIIGAGRNRNGIGEYIGKYFHLNGAEVTSVLGTSEETSRGATTALRKYGIVSAPYTNFYRMAEQEKPDGVVIASPSATHYDYLLKCVDLGVHIFCEKPFVWQPPGDLERSVEDILRKADEKKLTVAMNSQWPFAMASYEALCGPVEVKPVNTFSVLMSPFSPGMQMIPESVPHALSLVYGVFGEGEIHAVECESPGEKEMLITFRYLSKKGACDVAIQLVSQKDQPREFRFGFNDRMVTRSIHLKTYEISFHYGDRQIRIVDPLHLSVKDFIEAVKVRREPLIGPGLILNNTVLVKKIYDGCEGRQKKRVWKS